MRVAFWRSGEERRSLSLEAAFGSAVALMVSGCLGSDPKLMQLDGGGDEAGTGGGGGAVAGGGASGAGRGGKGGAGLGGADASVDSGGGASGLRDAAGDAPGNQPDATTSCAEGAPCVPSNPCHLGKRSCSGDASMCVDTGNQPNGAPCNDGNACTQTDECEGGVCTGSGPVVCTASDACHQVGSCDKTTGACSTPSQPDGHACDTSMVCSGGSCGCATGTSMCSGKCVNEATDKSNCGACGHSCLSGQCSASSCQAWVVQQLKGGTTGIQSDGASVVWLDLASKKVLQVPVSGGTPIALMTPVSAGGRLVMANGVVAVSVQNALGQLEVFVATEGAVDSGYSTATIGNNDSSMANFGLAINATGGTVFSEVFDFTGSAGSSIQSCVVGSFGCTKLMDAAPSDAGDDMLANANYLFFTVDSGGRVARYSFANKSTTDVATGQGGPYVLALDTTHAYWGNKNATAFVVNRASQTNPNPASPEPVIPSTVGELNSLATDGKFLYYAGKIGTTKVGYVPVAGGARTPLYTGSSGMASSLVSAGGAIYFYDSADQTIRGIAQPR